MQSGVDEVEVKFIVRRLAGLEQRARERGSRLITPRTHETNLRFDTPSGELRRGHRALRLRQDSSARLTYKGPGALTDGVRIRPELEVQVADFETTRAILGALGYVVVFEYEKYRTTYDLDGVEVMLDELPYGDFVELEGNLASLRPVAESLELRWDAAVSESYHTLFELLQARRLLPFAELTFANFAHTPARISDLGFAVADS